MSPPFPAVTPPDRADVESYARRAGIELTSDELTAFTTMIGDKGSVLRLLDELWEGVEDTSGADREAGARTTATTDPLNAFVTTCEIGGNNDGPLGGRTVGIKDNIPVAGVEMTLGSPAFEGFVPTSDAVAVERVLAAGATVTGKTNLDELAISGSGELGLDGPILNPHDPDYLAGGSSGGSAVAVVTGDIDIALGTDQAGSIRTPAAWCGCVGIKPTFGSVPYDGCVPGGHTYDHVGPMARTVRDCALALDAIEGESEASTSYVESLDDGIDDLTIGILEEGFDLEHSDPAVDQTVRSTVTECDQLGANVRNVSVDWHRNGILVWLGVGWTENAALLRDAGQGYGHRGPYHLEYLAAFIEAMETRSDQLAPTVKLKLLMGEHLRSTYHGRYHAIAQNLREPLRAAYDNALETVDLLAMPTTPTTAFEVEADLTLTELVRRSQGKEGRTTNTMPFNMTGHPAISVPCGVDDDGLPIGLMLVGRHGEEASVVRAAHAIETELG